MTEVTACTHCIYAIYVICLQGESSVSTYINIVLYDTKHGTLYM